MQEPRQHDLIPLEDTLGAAPVETEEQASRYTLAHVRKHHPERIRSAEALMVAGYGLQETADITGLAFRSVQALASQSPEIVSAGKKMTARLAGNVGRVALERINEYLATCTITKPQEAQQLATVAGIALDKAQVLDGEPSEIVQHQAPGLTDVGGLMSQLLPAQPVSAGESAGTKGVEEAAVVAALPGGAVIAASRRIVREEAKSSVRQAEGVILSGSGAGVAGFVADEPILEASEQAPAVAGELEARGAEAPGGGVDSSRPSSRSYASDSQNFFGQRDQSETEGATE